MKLGLKRLLLSLVLGLAVSTFVLSTAVFSTAFAEGTPTTTDSTELSNLEAAQALIDSEDYEGALTMLEGLMAEGESADIHNLMAYSLRNLENYDSAMEHYMAALELEPEHLGANEYLGELYLRLGEADKAQTQLEALSSFGCEAGCEQYDTLAQAITEFATTGKVNW